MEKVIKHLIENPEEAFAVITGNASPLGLNVSELFEVIRFFSNDNILKPVAGFWT